jgi:hypothetical protein
MINKSLTLFDQMHCDNRKNLEDCWRREPLPQSSYKETSFRSIESRSMADDSCSQLYFRKQTI